MKQTITTSHLWPQYIITVLLVVLAAATRIWPFQALESGQAWLTFYPAIIVAALYGRVLNGLLATLLSCLALFFFWPFFSAKPFITDYSHRLGLFIFIFNGAMISIMIEALHRSKLRTINSLIKAEEANTNLKQVAKNLKRYEAIIGSSEDAIISKSLDGLITSWNHGAELMFGYSLNEALGQPISILITEPYQYEEAMLMEKIRNGIAVKHYETVRRHKTGRLLHISVSLSPIRDDNGNIIGASKVARDITAHKLAEEVLQKSEANLRAILNNSPYLTWLKDTSGHYIMINKAFADYLRLENFQQAAGKTDFDLHPKELAEKYRADDIEVMASRKQKHTEECGFDRNKFHCVESYKTPVIDSEGKVLGTVGFARDITARKQIETALRISAVAFEAQEAMVITDPKGVILQINRAFTESTGYTVEEAIGKTPRLLKSNRHDESFYQEMWKNLLLNSSWQGEIWDRRKNGEIYPKWLTISAVKDDNGITTHYVGSHFDITERKLAEEQIKNLAFYDPLTCLPNRRLLLDRLQQALTFCERSGRKGALLFIDLDNFKTLNDTLGHNIGDLLLQQVAQRLESCVRVGDTVARLGGDEFVVLLESLSKETLEAAAQAEGIGEKILACLNQPYFLGKHEHHNTPSIGITLFNELEHAVEDLFKQADLAMYQAKKSGRNTLRFFDPKMQELINARSTIELELRKAIENNEFKLYYQIQINNDNQPVGAEALIRWNHPEIGMVPSIQFIPLAEESGQIIDIGHWVLETACAQLKTWQLNEITQHLILSINVSAKQFHQENFVSEVKETLLRHDVKPNLLNLELTESFLLEKIDETIITMNALGAIGVQISLDDFGTGYSSLQYLKLLPLNQLKIDQSFVRDIAIDDSDKAIVRTIIAMAHSLNLDVIAEGVETDEQKRFLDSAGCKHFQGYLFSKPIPIDEFDVLLNRVST